MELRRRPLRDLLGNRPTLILEEPLVKRLGVDPLIVPSTGEAVDTSIDVVKREKIEEWRAKGVPEGMSKFAVKLAEEYAQGMAEFMLPGEPDMQKAVLPTLFKSSLKKVSEPWIKGVYRAMYEKEVKL